MFDKLFSAFKDKILGTILGLAISGVLAIAARGFGRRRHRRLVEALTGFDLDERPIAVIGAPLHARPGSTDTVRHVDGLPLFGYGPLTAYATLAARYFSAHSSQKRDTLPEIVVSTQFAHLPTESQRDRDLLLLGYPAGNEASRLLEPMMSLPLEFAADGRRALLNKTSGELLGEAEYDSSESDTRRTLRDCGLLACVHHPFNNDKSVLYLAGCETFGVKIAADGLRPDLMPAILGLHALARFTWRHAWLPWIGLSRVRTTEFVAVLKADVHNLVTTTPSLSWAWIRTPNGTWKQTYPAQTS